MPADIINFPNSPRADLPDNKQDFFTILPLSFRTEHCEAARTALGWSVEALAFRSGASLDAIRKVERGIEMRRVTMQALAFAFETEGLIFFPGHPPFRSDDCRGATPDPRTRDDYCLLE